MHRLHLTAEEMARHYSVDDFGKRTAKVHAPSSEDGTQAGAGGRAAATHEAAADRQGLDSDVSGKVSLIMFSGRMEVQVLAVTCCDTDYKL